MLCFYSARTQLWDGLGGFVYVHFRFGLTLLKTKLVLLCFKRDLRCTIHYCYSQCYETIRYGIIKDDVEQIFFESANAWHSYSTQ